MSTPSTLVLAYTVNMPATATDIATIKAMVDAVAAILGGGVATPVQVDSTAVPVATPAPVTSAPVVSVPVSSPTPVPSPEDAVTAKYFPADPGLASFPSPENNRMIRNADGTVSGRPYLLDSNAEVHRLVPVSDAIPNGYTVNGKYISGGGSDHDPTIELLVRQGKVYADVRDNIWQTISQNGLNNSGLPDAFPTDASGATTSTVAVSNVTVPSLPASKLGLLATGKTLTVGKDKAFQTITAAVAAMADGDTIAIDAGTYLETPPVLSKVFHLVGVGGTAVIDATGLTGSLAYGKGALVPVADGIIEGIRVTGVAMDQVGAQLTSGVRPDVGCNYLTLKNVELDNNQSGLGTGGNLTIEITVDGGHFHHNGLNPGVDGNGYTHNIYTGENTQLILKNGFISDDPNGGHAVKARGQKFTADGCTITAGGDAAAIDLAQGTVIGTVTNCAVTKAAGYNHSVINYGTDSLASGNGGLLLTGGSLTMQCDNPFFNINAGSVITIDKSVVVSGTKPTVEGGGKLVGLSM